MGDRVMERKGKDVEEMQGMGSGEVTLAERCYNTNNSTAERQTLSRLEQELQAAFCFKHGGGHNVSPMWVVRILMGWILQERMALGRTIK
jgi:hypothetical protein